VGTSGSGSVSNGGTLTFAGSNGFTATVSGSTVTLGNPQNLQTSASPTFAGLTLTSGATLQSTLSVTGAITTGVTSGTILTSSGTGGDTIGYNPSYGTYIGGASIGGGSAYLYSGLNSGAGPIWNKGGTTYTVLHSGNYTSYSPGVTGTGASGTWGISVSGNAATATLASNSTLAGGLAIATGTNNAANQIVRTDAYGYIQAGYINSGNGNEGNNFSPPRVWGTNGSDSYMRTYLTSALSVNTAVYLTGAPAFTNGSDGWWRSNGQAGWYSNTYATGIYSTSSGLVQTYNSSSFQVNGALYATSSITAYYSDERLKTKVGKIENALDKVDQLSGFLYVENDLAKSLGFKNEQQQVALSAQAVQKVQPEAVALAPFDRETDGTSKSGENYLTVQYEKLVPLLVEAIKELRGELNIIKAQLKG
jgi:hypothetical protein